MKRSEVAMIILVASLSMLLTFTLSQSLLGDKVKRKASVEQATAISQDIEQPAKRTFNEDAINPTVQVCVEKSQSDTDVAASPANCTGSNTTSTDSSTSAAAESQSGNKTTN